MRFWDSSAVVPLLVEQERSETMKALVDADRPILVWWATPIECVSAVARLERERALTAGDADAALATLDAISESWQEVLPAGSVRRTARRLLRVHPLRAADALRLAAAVVAGEGDEASLEFVTLDQRLAEVARREGLAVWSDA